MENGNYTLLLTVVFCVACGCAGDSVTASDEGQLPAGSEDEDDAGTTTLNGAGDADAGDVAGSCDEERAALVSFIEDNRSCVADSDCHSARSFCLFEGRVDCTGAFYMNANATTAEFRELDDALTDCTTDQAITECMRNQSTGCDRDRIDTGCGHCAKSESPAVCRDGLCTPSEVP